MSTPVEQLDIIYLVIYTIFKEPILRKRLYYGCTRSHIPSHNFSIVFEKHYPESSAHSTRSDEDEVKRVVSVIKKNNILSIMPG